MEATGQMVTGSWGALRRILSAVGIGLVETMILFPKPVQASPHLSTCGSIQPTIVHHRERPSLKGHTHLLISMSREKDFCPDFVGDLPKYDCEKDLLTTEKITPKYEARIDRTSAPHHIASSHSIYAMRRGGYIYDHSELGTRASKLGHHFSEIPKKGKLYVSCILIVTLWVTIGTIFYSRFYDWPLSQGFFYAIDAGMSIGFCTGKNSTLR